jgi:beta-mannosidase
LDYFGRWKALHYAAKRFYAPVMLSILDEGVKMGGQGTTELPELVKKVRQAPKVVRMAVHVTSDLVELFEGEVRWTLMELDGKVVKSGKAEVHAKPLSDVEVCVKEFNLSDELSRKTVFIVELYQGEKRLALNLATFCPNKYLELEQPGIEVDLQRVGKDVFLHVKATQSLARFVELKFEGLDVVFSDNYFDVPAGRTVTVTCPMPVGKTLAQMRKALRVQTLRDSY